MWYEVVDIYTIKGQLPKIFENDVIILHIRTSSNYAVKYSRNSSCIRWLNGKVNQCLRTTGSWPGLNYHMSWHLTFLQNSTFQAEKTFFLSFMETTKDIKDSHSVVCHTFYSKFTSKATHTNSRLHLLVSHTFYSQFSSKATHINS